MALWMQRWSMRGLLALVLVTFLLLCERRSAPPAQAFKLYVHEEILEKAFKDKMNDDARAMVTGHFYGVFGTGAAASDSVIGQFGDYLHFDSANSPTQICERWQLGVKASLGIAASYVDGLARYEAGLPVLNVDYRKQALERFGTVTHAIADFYAHSNWIELEAARVAAARQGGDSGADFRTAPLLGATCNPADFPSDLQTGYASMAWYIARGGAGALGGGILGALLPIPGGTGLGAAGGAYASLGWCNPVTGPPEGFKYCHDDLAKDQNSDYGATPLSTSIRRQFQINAAPGQTLHSAAVELATRDTAALWSVFHDQAVARIAGDAKLMGRKVNAECIWHKLAYGGDEACASLCGDPQPAAGQMKLAAPAGAPALQPMEQTPPMSCPVPVASLCDLAPDRPGQVLVPAGDGKTRCEVKRGCEEGLTGVSEATGELVSFEFCDYNIIISKLASAAAARAELDPAKIGSRNGETRPSSEYGEAALEQREGQRRPPSNIASEYRLGFARGAFFVYVFATTANAETARTIARAIDERLKEQPSDAPLTSGAPAPGAGPTNEVVDSAVDAPPEAGWSGTFTTSRGAMQLTIVNNLVTGSFDAGDAPAVALEPARGGADQAKRGAQELPGSTGRREAAAEQGRIAGSVVGNRLRGIWVKPPTFDLPDDAGDLDLTLAADGRSFEGRWNSAGDGRWTDWTGAHTGTAMLPSGSPTPPTAPPSTTTRPPAPAPTTAPAASPTPAPPQPSSTPAPVRPAAPLGEPRLTVEPNRSSFRVGERIRFCFTLPVAGDVTLTNTLSDGTRNVVSSGPNDGSGGCFDAEITPPLGRECLRIDLRTATGSAFTELCFEVQGASPPPAAAPPAPPPSAPPPTGASGQARLTLTPEKGAYRIGETVRVCYTVPGRGQVVITDNTADGRRTTLLSTQDDGRGACFNAQIAPPVGRECLRIDFQSASGSSWWEVCFTVQP